MLEVKFPDGVKWWPSEERRIARGHLIDGTQPPPIVDHVPKADPQWTFSQLIDKSWQALPR